MITDIDTVVIIHRGLDRRVIMDSKSPLGRNAPGAHKSVAKNLQKIFAEWVDIRRCFEYNKSEPEMVLKAGDSPPIYRVRNCKAGDSPPIFQVRDCKKVFRHLYPKCGTVKSRRGDEKSPLYFLAMYI